MVKQVNIVDCQAMKNAKPLIKNEIVKIRSSQSQKDWHGVSIMAASLREAHQDVPEAYEAEIDALRKLRMFDEAECVFASALKLFPERASLMVEGVRNAHVKKDWAETASRAQELRLKHPKQPAGFESGVTALRELKLFSKAEALLAEAILLFPNRPSLLVQAVSNARAMGDSDATLERAIKLRETFPEQVVGYEAALDTLCRQGKLVEADSIVKLASVALKDSVAISKMQALLSKASGYVQADNLLKDDAAISILNLEAALTFATHPSTIAGQQIGGGRRESVRRLRSFIEKFPDTIEFVVALGCELYLLSCFDELDELLSGYVPKFLDDESFVLLWARVADARSNRGDANLRYSEAKKRFPQNVAAHIGYLNSLLAVTDVGNTSNRENLESSCLDTINRFPKSPVAHEIFGRIAQAFGDQATAIHRWKKALENFPTQHQFRTRILDAELSLLEVGYDNHEGSKTEDAFCAATTSVFEQQPSEFLTQFRSLGSIVNGCEFGLIQRHYGSEPLGLFRWAGSPIANLINAMEQNFEGLGRDEDTTISISPTGTDEYIIRSTRYLINFHTLIHINQMPKESCLAQMKRRLSFLAKKLRDDLASGEGVFVYKTYRELVSDDDLDRLHRSIVKYGSNLLFSVQEASEYGKHGSVKFVKPGLIIGYMSHFHKSSSNVENPHDYEVWLKLCRSAYLMWQEYNRFQNTNGRV